jgi:hypothetical protein
MHLLTGESEAGIAAVPAGDIEVWLQTLINRLISLVKNLLPF